MPYLAELTESLELVGRHERTNGRGTIVSVEDLAADLLDGLDEILGRLAEDFYIDASVSRDRNARTQSGHAGRHSFAAARFGRIQQA